MFLMNEQLLTTSSYSRLPSIDTMVESGGLDIQDEQTESPDCQIDRSHLAGVLHRALGKLDKRQQLVLSLRFGLKGKSRSLSSIGNQIGLTHQRVQQLEVESLEMLRGELSYLEHQT